MFFSDSFSIIRILVVGTLSYLSVLLVLRVSGKRTLSKMNSFDFIVTIALGSVLANILTSQDVALVDGILSFSLLVFLQFAATWVSVRSDFFNSLIKSSPKLLYYRGRFDEIAMKKERVPKVEILQAIRSDGDATLEDVLAVVLETDGSFSIITKTGSDEAEYSSFSNVESEKIDL